MGYTVPHTHVEREREREGGGTVVEIGTEIDRHAMIYFLEFAV